MLKQTQLSYKIYLLKIKTENIFFKNSENNKDNVY